MANFVRGLCLALMMLVTLAVGVLLAVFSYTTGMFMYVSGELSMAYIALALLGVAAAIGTVMKVIALDQHMGRVCNFRLLRIGVRDETIKARTWQDKSEANVAVLDDIPEDVLADMREQYLQQQRS